MNAKPTQGRSMPADFTPAHWVAQANIDLMNNPTWCTLSCVLACGNLTLTDTVPTAATDGWNVVVNPAFVRSLRLPELRFVLAHEALHKAYQHLHLWRKCWAIDPKLTNIAADLYVNLAIMDADAGAGFVAMPAVGVQPEEKYRGMSVGQIFEKLRQEQQSDPQSGKSEGEGFDAHDWENAQQGDAQQQGEQREAIEQAMRQGEVLRRELQRRAGKGSGGADVPFDLLAARVDWRQQLAEFVREAVRTREESSWRRPNRRFLVDDVYLPSLDGQGVGELAIGIDTSGSCFGGPEMSRFVSELQAIVQTVKPSRVHVVYWDAKVTGHQTFEGEAFDVSTVKPKGGGGTDAAVLFDYLRAKRIQPVAIINFTDGMVGGSWGRADCPVLWAITSPRITASFGRTLHIDL